MLGKQGIGFPIMAVIFFVAMFLSHMNSGISITPESHWKCIPYLQVYSQKKQYIMS